MCIQVVKKGKRLPANIDTGSRNKRTKIEYQLDTGASCNILNQKYYLSCGAPALSQKKLPNLQLYDGTHTRTTGLCKLGSTGKTFRFYVVKTGNMSLLSLDKCLELGLLSINNEWVNFISPPEHADVDQLIQEYGLIFEGVGCLPGEYRIEVDPNVSPTQSINRKVALSIRQDLKDKLDSLTDNKIIAKVDYPTPWISNTLARRKPNGKL